MKKDQLQVWLEPSKKQAFKIFCVQNALSMHDVVDGFIEEILAGKHEAFIERLKKEKRQS